MRIWLAAAMVAFATTAFGGELPAASDYVMWLPCEGTSKDNCEYVRTVFPEDYRKALKKDYQGQRNVAFCLSTGCDGAISVRDTLGCAWRIVILASGSPKVDDTDIANYKLECGRLDQPKALTAREQARTIFKTVYGRDLPAGF